MSFSSQTKSELAQVTSEKRCCMLAEISGFTRMCGTIRLAGPGRVSLRLLTENAAAARKMIKLLKEYFGIGVELVISKNQMLKKNNYYEMIITEEMGCQAVLRETGILSVREGFNVIDYGVADFIVKKKCCKRAFLRGAFLGGGSLSDPEKAYHLEMVTSNEALGRGIISVMNSLGLSAKMVERKKHYIVYVKESERIVDFLNYTGAHGILLEYENVRILKEMRNRANRMVNCDNANLDKTMDAAQKQIQAIEKIRDTKGLDFLPPKLYEIALLRLAEPDSSLKELGEQMDPPLGKSGVNHRLARIEEIARRL